MAETNGPNDERDFTTVTRGCFGCGTENPCSLRLRPYRRGDRIVADFELARSFRGYSNVAHGGITTTVLDELMGAAASVLLGAKLATTRIEVSYRRPLFVERRARGEAWVVDREGRDVRTAARIVDDRDRLVAEAQAVFRLIPASSERDFVTSAAPG